MINKPQHQHVKNYSISLDYLKTGRQTRRKKARRSSPTNTSHAIHKYDDLVLMVFCVVAIAVLYLNSDGSIVCIEVEVDLMCVNTSLP